MSGLLAFKDYCQIKDLERLARCLQGLGKSHGGIVKDLGNATVRVRVGARIRVSVSQFISAIMNFAKMCTL